MLHGHYRKLRTLVLISLVAVLSFVPVQQAFSQYSANPLDPIYHWMDLWEGRGYIERMPVFRPYPENILVAALERVARVGDAESREVAKTFLNQLDDALDIEFSVFQETRVQNDKLHLKGGVGITAHGRISDTITAAASLTGVLLDVEDGELLPRSRRTDWDILDDWSTIPVAGRDVAALNQMNTSFAWGTESLYLHAGIMRRSFGPMHDDGVVLSPYARQAPGIVTSWRPGAFQYSFGIFSMTASQLYDDVSPFREPNTAVVADSGTDDLFRFVTPQEQPGKWVFIHDFRWNALPWLTVAFFESVTWGPRFEIAYLMPVKWGFHAQGSVSYADSSKMGFSVEARPRRDLHIPLVVYVDDASFNDLVRFNFNTKLKMAVHTGIVWTPLQPVLRRVSLDYLALLPYMYTHDGEDGHFATEPNFTNYVHQGESLGPGLSPNSDRTTLSLTVQPLPRLDATIMGRLIRHGNASEGVEGLGLVSHDGSILDDGRYYYFRRQDEVDATSELVIDSGRLSFQDELRFLTQDTIEHTWQTGIDFAYRLPVKPERRMGISLEAGYQFEFIKGPLEFRPSVETAILRDPSRTEDTQDLEAILYETVAGNDVVNHYFNFRVRVLY